MLVEIWYKIRTNDLVLYNPNTGEITTVRSTYKTSKDSMKKLFDLFYVKIGEYEC